MKYSVVGALGKMGKGISALLLTYLTLLFLKEKKAPSLVLIDVRCDDALEIKQFFREQLKKSGEKEINFLRQAFKDRPDLVSNGEMIQEFIAQSLDMIEISPLLESARGSDLIFEAAFEDIDLKTRLLSQLKQIAPGADFFTNTSSIPIHLLDEKAHLEGRIIGFHFYNPPTQQPLMEIVPLQSSPLLEKALKLAKDLNKTAVVSKDVPGFIGNGHFLREVQFALNQADSVDTIALLQSVTQDFLLRPMGIFQLVDFVGIDICQKIAETMRLEIPLLDKALQAGLKGGQHPDGKPKNGFLNYPLGQVYSFTEKKYIPVEKHPHELSWKKLHKDPNCREIVASYFHSLFQDSSKEAKLSKEYLEASLGFMEELVKNRTAQNLGDVSKVLKLGFYHLYSPDEVIHA